MIYAVVVYEGGETNILEENMGLAFNTQDLVGENVKKVYFATSKSDAQIAEGVFSRQINETVK